MEALNLKHEYELAEMLGFKRVAFSERKKRNSVPEAEIKLLCINKSINPNWIFYGEGDAFVVSDQNPPAYAATTIHQGLTPGEAKLLELLRANPAARESAEAMTKLPERKQKIPTSQLHLPPPIK